MEMEIEDNYMIEKDEDSSVFHRDQSKALPINITQLPDSSKHVSEQFVFGNWELVQWFQFCRPKNTDDSRPKGTIHNNDHKNRKMESVKVHCLMHLENYLVGNENAKYLDVPVAPALSAQEEQSLTVPNRARNVNTIFTGRDKINITQLSTPDEMKARIKNENTLREFSTYLNDISSRCDLPDQINGTKREDLFGYVNGCERIFSFPNIKSEFEDIKSSVICEDLQKNMPTEYNLDTIEELQDTAISLSSCINEHSFFKNKIHLHNLFCREDRTIFSRVLTGLQFRIPQAQTEIETDHTYCECQPRHAEPSKARHNKELCFAEKQNVQITANMLNTTSIVSKSWEFRPFSVGKQDVLWITISKACSGGLLANAEITTQKTRKRKMQVEVDDEVEHNVKRYLKCSATVDAAMSECKESININDTFGVIGEKVICSIAAKCNECWTPLKMTESRLKYTGNSNKVSRNCGVKMFDSRNKGFSNIEHFLLPTVSVFDVMKPITVWFRNIDTPFHSKATSQEHFVKDAATLTIVFPKELSVYYGGNFEPAHFYMPQYEMNDIKTLLTMRFKYFTLETFSIPYITSENNNEDMSCKSHCIQFEMLMHEYTHLIKSNRSILGDELSFTNFTAKFLKTGGHFFILKTFILSSLKELFILIGLMSEQDQCKPSGKLKCNQTSSVTFHFIYSDRKELSLKNSEMLFYCPCKVLLKETNAFIIPGMSTQKEFFTVCNGYSPLFEEIKFTNINVFMTAMIHTEDISHLCNLCFMEQCIGFPDIAKKYISAPNYVNSDANCSFEKILNWGFSVVSMTSTKQMYVKENTQKSKKRTAMKENMPLYCMFSESNTNEKNSSQSKLEVEIADFSHNATNTQNTITLKNYKRKKWGKSQMTSVRSSTCLFSILDTYQKIPLASTFEDQDIITLTSHGNFGERIETSYANVNSTFNVPNTSTAHLTDLTASSSYFLNVHDCADIVNATKTSSKWLYPQMGNLNLALHYEEKCSTEGVKEACDNAQFLDNTALYVKLPVFDHDSGTIAESFSTDAHCCVNIRSGSDSARNYHIPMSTFEHFEDFWTDEIKESPLVLPIPKTLENTNYTLEQEHETQVSKHIPQPSEYKQMMDKLYKDGFEPVELDHTTEQKLYSNETCFVKQCTNEKSMPRPPIPEAMLASTILCEFGIASKQQALTDLNISTESSIALMELPSVDQTQLTFAMKPQYDLVLEELAMFHEISWEQEAKSSHEKAGSAHYQPETYDLANEQERNKKDGKYVSENTLLPCSDYPKIKRQTISKSPGLYKRKASPRKQEQEVPNVHLYSSTTEEESLYLTTNEDDSQLESKVPLLWTPAFSPLRTLQEGSKLSLDEYGGCFLHGIGRVQPLKTRIGPIRVGLSKKAKTERLHPYLKQIY